ncbi:MAG TPA: Uma2 family endonuclease [Thermoanaerobaculia bacterium]|jgi:Uma2 family endonuclease|nr:Uma2 family endonuclease [Thermoanaerobaculia bacterium]
MNAIPLRRDVHYPESDGKPMGETEIHIREIIYLLEALNEHLREVPEVYVGADMLLYYVEGNPRQFVVPDVFVTLGVPRGQRRIYKLWEEGRPPTLIVEVTSDSTRNEDVSRKKSLYEGLGVEEYFLYDPLQDYLRPALQGFRLVNGRYQPLPAGIDGAILSRATGATFRLETRGIRLLDTATGKPILSNEEVRAELDRLRAEMAHLRGDR